MLSCPNCKHRLLRLSSNRGIVFGCASCGGSMMSLPILRKDRAAADFVREVWVKARSGKTTSSRLCPHCKGHMSLVNVLVKGRQLDLEVCVSCQSIWFDPKEYERVPKQSTRREPEPLSPRAREASALQKVNQIREAETAATTSRTPDAAWKYIPGLLGMPVEFDGNPVSRIPVVVWSVTVAALIAFLIMLKAPEAVIKGFGFIPGEWYRHGGLTIITSFFLHAGFYHIISNLYFFVVFGDNVEDHLGRKFFILVLAASHVLGLILHGFFDPRGDVPLVGASAGISGVIAYYAIAFPKARLGFLFFFFFWLRMPAVVALVLYFMLQIFGATNQMAGYSNVSYLGHLGGLIIGVAAGIAARYRRIR